MRSCRDLAMAVIHFLVGSLRPPEIASSGVGGFEGSGGVRASLSSVAA